MHDDERSILAVLKLGTLGEIADSLDSLTDVQTMLLAAIFKNLPMDERSRVVSELISDIRDNNIQVLSIPVEGE